MVLESILSGLGGGLLRMAPELLKFFDRKGERAHELALQDRQLELTKLQQTGALASAQIVADSTAYTEQLSTLRTAYETQFRDSGIKWVNALSATVRPVVTYLVVSLWALTKFAAYSQVVRSNIHWDAAILTIWGENDVVLLTGIIGFWFVSRAVERKAGA